MSTKKPKQIFIVDDNDIYSMMLGYILSKDSIYKFVNFKSGRECIENLHLNPEIIILDYEMSGLNGYDTLLEIKKHNSRIHVVILTINDDEKLKEKLLMAGADYFVLKQGHGETQIIEKIEDILYKQESIRLQDNLRKILLQFSQKIRVPIRKIIITPIKELIAEYTLRDYLTMFIVTFISIGTLVFVGLKIFR